MSRHATFNIPVSDDTLYNDAYVTWLMHFDGPQGSAYAIDYSRKRNGPVVISNGTISAGGKFGPTSLALNSQNGLCYSPVNLDNSFNLSDNDFTIDWWEYCHDNTVARPSFEWDTLGIVYVPMLVGWGTDALYFYASNDQATWNLAASLPMGNRQVGAWCHRAIVRKGGTFYTFQNGILQGTQAVGGNGVFNICTYGPCLGAWTNPGGYAYMYGHIDEFRVSNGIARWTANFTPPNAQYGPEPDLNTVLLMHFDNLADSSQYKRGLATASGGAVISSITPTPFGGAFSLYLNRAAQCYISYPDHAHWVIGTQDFTADAWVYISDYPAAGDNYGIITQMDGAGDYSNRHLMLYINSDGAVVSDANNAGVQVYFTGSPGAAVPFNTWTHVAVVRNGTAVQIYVNGTLRSGFAIPAGTSFKDYTGPLRIGGMGDAGENRFKGYIDEVRFVIGKALWTAEFTPPAELLPLNPDKTVLLLHFDGNFNDSSRERQVVQKATAVIDIQQKKFGTAAALFGGNNLCYVPTAPASMNFGAGDFTIDCWFRDSGPLGTNRGLFGRCHPNLTELTCGALLGTDNRMQCWFGKTGSDWVTQGVVGVHDVTQNVWHHWAVTRQNGVFRSYLDGILDAGPNDYGNFPIYVSTWSFVIGAIGNNTNYWTGYIDEFRITMGRALWTANFTPPIQPGS